MDQSWCAWRAGLVVAAALVATTTTASSQVIPSAKAAVPPPKAAAPTAAPVCDRAQFRAVIDVGHTPDAIGARSARGAAEYDFNFRLAREIDQRMVDAGFDKTELLVTEGKAKPSLSKRVERTNNLRPDIFLSIHHDSVPDRFLEKWEYEGVVHTYSDRFKGHSIFVSWDNPLRSASLRFAQLLGLQMKDRGLQYTPHYTQSFMGSRQRVLVDAAAGVYRYDQLRVLRETKVPAVLLEAGSIINRDEELQLDEPEHRALISAAVTDAMDGYCATLPRTRPVPVQAKR
jgi:N-acetylmuramoyl-L-alanine amidase